MCIFLASFSHYSMTSVGLLEMRVGRHAINNMRCISLTLLKQQKMKACKIIGHCQIQKQRDRVEYEQQKIRGNDCTSEAGVPKTKRSMPGFHETCKSSDSEVGSQNQNAE